MVAVKSPYHDHGDCLVSPSPTKTVHMAQKLEFACHKSRGSYAVKVCENAFIVGEGQVIFTDRIYAI